MVTVVWSNINGHESSVSFASSLNTYRLFVIFVADSPASLCLAHIRYLFSVVLPIVESSIAHCHNSSYCPTQISIIFITRQFFVESRQCCIFMRKFDSPLAPRVLKSFLPSTTNKPSVKKKNQQNKHTISPSQDTTPTHTTFSTDHEASIISQS
jgi:hypothetical protein